MFMKLYKIILLFVLLIFISCNSRENSQAISSDSPGKNKKKEIILENLEMLNTPYIIGYPDENDPDWKQVKLPLIHELPEPYFDSLRCFWIRGEFNIESYDKYKPSDYYVINLGMIAASECVYINKQFAGEFNFTGINKWLWPRTHIIPPGIKLNKKNEVYVRIIVYRSKYITLISDISIQNQSTYLHTESWNNFLYNQFPMGFSILLIGIFAILLRNYFHFGNKRYLFYALYVFIVSISTFLNYSPVNLLNPEISGAIIVALAFISLFLLLLILQSLYGLYFIKQNIISASIFFLISIYSFIYMLSPFDFDIIFQPFLYPTILLFIYTIYLIHLLNSHKPDMFKYRLCISFSVILFIIGVMMFLGIIYNIWNHHFYHMYSIPVYAVIIIIYETREAGKRKIELVNIYRAIDGKKSSNGLSESAEQKMQSVISYINDNYTCDISREGLASAVNMNHDYMSRLFYMHTGKKISEYINHLRITDAAEQLKDTEKVKKIIDVALAVGFESQSTFNRIFKDIIGVTPTEYKKKYN